MCRIPKVLLVGPAERLADLRRMLSSLEYEIVAAVTPDQIGSIRADVAVVWEPEAGTAGRLRENADRVVAVGGDPEGADMALAPEDAGGFRTRIWELFRPQT